MEIQVKDIESHIARARHTDQRVHVGSIIIEQSSALVDEGSDLPYLLLEQAESVGVGHHDTSDVRAKKRLKISHIHKAVSVGFHDHNLQAANSGAGRVRAMGAVRDYHLGTGKIPTENMVLTHNHQSGKLSMSTGARVKGESCHPGDRGKGLVHIIIDLQGSLD